MPALGPKHILKRRTGQSIAALGLLVCTTLARAQSQDGGPSAETWFRLGKMLSAQGKTEQAYEAYAAAWRLNQRSPEVACNLGDIELELGKNRDAAEHLSFCSGHFPVTGTEKQRKAMRARFEKARAKVGTITIELQPQHAAISVDGKPAGESPLEDAIFVEPGIHTIKMEREGYLQAEKQVDVEADQRITLSFSLKPKPSDKPPPPPPPPSLAPWWPIFITGGLALTGIGLGVGMLLGSNSKQDEANALWLTLARQDGRGACNLSKNADNCNALDSSTSQASLFHGFSIGGFVGGGVAAIATGVFLWRALLPPAGPSSPAATGLAVELYPGGGSAIVRGVF